jgi:hypothetical protein
MLKSSILPVVILLCSAGAQIAPPKPVAPAQMGDREAAENYGERLDAIRCAIVLVQSTVHLSGKDPETHYGTGFYISDDGDVVTASHILGDRTWTRKLGSKKISVKLPTQLDITITNNFDPDSGSTSFHRDDIEKNGDWWAADVVRIKTREKVRSGCWLLVGDDTKVRAGDPVITMGFPEFTFGVPSLYAGIVSATNLSLENRVFWGSIEGSIERSTPKNPFIHVQMPICPGLSGSPIIDDQNRVVAVITLAGEWPEEELRPLTDAWTKYWNTPPEGPQASPSDLRLAVGALAHSFHYFASPGYGYSVPLCYLDRPLCDPKKSKRKSDRTPSLPHR